MDEVRFLMEHDEVKFRRGELPYTHHHVVVQIGSNGIDQMLDIAVTELDDIQAYLNMIRNGLEVLDVENDKIDEWMELAQYQVSDTKRMLDHKVGELLKLHEVAIIRTARFSDDGRTTYAETTDEEHEAQLKAIRERHKKSEEIPF